MFWSLVQNSYRQSLRGWLESSLLCPDKNWAPSIVKWAWFFCWKVGPVSLRPLCKNQHRYSPDRTTLPTQKRWVRKRAEETSSLTFLNTAKISYFQPFQRKWEMKVSEGCREKCSQVFMYSRAHVIFFEGSTQLARHNLSTWTPQHPSTFLTFPKTDFLLTQAPELFHIPMR